MTMAMTAPELMLSTWSATPFGCRTRRRGERNRATRKRFPFDRRGPGPHNGRLVQGREAGRLWRCLGAAGAVAAVVALVAATAAGAVSLPVTAQASDPAGPQSCGWLFRL